MAWYYVEGGQQIGPVSDADLQSLMTQGRITVETFVWQPGMPNWQKLGELQAERRAASAVPPPDRAVGPGAELMCCGCGNMFAQDDLIQYEGRFVCANCKEGFFQRVKQGVLLPGAYHYGGFWIRFAARFVDGIITSVAGRIILVPVSALVFASGRNEASIVAVFLVSTLTTFVIPLAYETWFVGRFGATPGKMLCKLRVIRPDGDSVTYMRAMGRYLAQILSSIILLIGYIMAAFDEEKRALHDRICDTRVVYKD